MAPPRTTPDGDRARRVAEISKLGPAALRDLLAGDQTAAAPWVEACAAEGLVEAQVRLGRMLLSGEGVEKDPGQAVLWFTRAAGAGDAEAFNMLGRCHEMAWGVPRDLRRAAACYGRAARQGHAWAQYNLGHLFLDGQGVARNPARAFALYRRAAALGHVRAMNLVGRCLEQGWGTARDAARARSWYQASAQGGYFRGCYNYASLLLDEGETAAAAAWFERALDSAPEPTLSHMRAALAARGITLGQHAEEAPEIGRGSARRRADKNPATN